MRATPCRCESGGGSAYWLPACRRSAIPNGSADARTDSGWDDEVTGHAVISRVRKIRTLQGEQWETTSVATMSDCRAGARSWRQAAAGDFDRAPTPATGRDRANRNRECPLPRRSYADLFDLQDIEPG